jgi:hypothetical protein
MVVVSIRDESLRFEMAIYTTNSAGEMSNRCLPCDVAYTYSDVMSGPPHSALDTEKHWCTIATSSHPINKTSYGN